MKLTDIDLNDKSEVSAAHALLSVILGHAVSDDIPGAPSLNETTGAIAHADRPDVGMTKAPAEVAAETLLTHQVPAPSVAAVIGCATTLNAPTDAAAVFGAPPVPFVPATAAVAPLPTAPVVATLPLPASTLPAPSTVPGAVAPLAPAAPLSPASGVELDHDGLPWDERIHAGTKRKNADGRWTAKRGLNDPALITRVTEEIRNRAAVAAPLQPSTATAVPLPPSGGPLVPAPVGVVSPTSFEQLMPLLTAATIAQKIPPTAANEACVAHGLQGVIALQQQPQHIPQIWAYLVQQFPGLSQ